MKLLGPKTFVMISITPILLIAIISLVSQPIYANSCQAFITTTPSGADVYVDGSLIGQSPILHFVGFPFSADIRVEREGFETWTTTINVALDEHKQVNVELTPLQVDMGGNGGTETVTMTVTTTVTTTSSTTTTSTTTATTIIAADTITVTSDVTTATTLTVTSTAKEPETTITSKITEQIGLPIEITYSAIGIAVTAIAAALYLASRRRI